MDSPRQSEPAPNLGSAIRALLAAGAKEKPAIDPIQQADLHDRATDTELKRLYAERFIWILIGQLAVMNMVFIAVGLGALKFEHESYLNLFMGGTLAEVFGVVLVITKYLFSRRSK